MRGKKRTKQSGRDNGNRRFLAHLLRARVSLRVEFLHVWRRKSNALPPLHLSLPCSAYDDASRRFISREGRSSVRRQTGQKNRPVSKYTCASCSLKCIPFGPFPHRVPTTFLCLQVRRATEAIQRLCQCPSEKCSKLNVRKVGEGRYHIAGRNVFIRVRPMFSHKLYH
jgi:hypothetical protein